MSKLTSKEIVLHCTSWHEAQRIADYLFGRRLIGSAETVVPGSQLAGAGAVAGGVRLICGSAENQLDAIISEVRTLLGHEIHADIVGG